MKKGNKEPNPIVQLSVQDTKKESKVTATRESVCTMRDSFISFKNVLFRFRFVTPPLIQSGRKRLPSSSKILTNKTSTFRWLLQSELLSMKRRPWWEVQEPVGMLIVFILNWPGKGCWPCAGAGQSDHPIVQSAVRGWPFYGPVVPVGQGWISQSYLCQGGSQGKWQQHTRFNPANKADRANTVKPRAILSGQHKRLHSVFFYYNTGSVVRWGTYFF